VNTDQLINRSGLTYRQVDHWCARGYLRPDEAHPGVGYARNFTADEVRIAVVMARLTRKGISVETAECIARSGPDLGDGVEVFVDRDRTPDSPTSRDVQRAVVLLSRTIVRNPKARRLRALRAARKAGTHS
jgi:DNA-binding transcriptional MerR regulator